MRELRRALRHLYDPDRLRTSSLCRLLPVDVRDSSSSLQRLLVQAIEALKPGPSLSPHSTNWRTYQILLSHYVQQFQQSEIAASLGLSLRQLRRYDSLAVQTLAEALWSRYRLQERATDWLLEMDRPSGEPTPGAREAPSRDSEIDWLERSVPREAVSISRLFAYLLETIAPLADKRGVEIEAEAPDDLAPLLAPLTPVREALLALLSHSVERVPGGRVRLVASQQRERVSIAVQPVAASPSGFSGDSSQGENAAVARELIAVAGGTLEMRKPPDAEGTPGYLVTFPASPLVPVLVIDDNEDTLGLFRRYLADTRYAFFGAADPTQALELALRVRPRVVVLDVMLPAVGGWETLARLREHPVLRGIPVVVCTILPQEQLAMALGAAAFLRKPVSRQALLAALDDQLARPSPGAG